MGPTTRRIRSSIDRASWAQRRRDQQRVARAFGSSRAQGACVGLRELVADHASGCSNPGHYWRVKDLLIALMRPVVPCGTSKLLSNGLLQSRLVSSPVLLLNVRQVVSLPPLRTIFPMALVPRPDTVSGIACSDETSSCDLRMKKKLMPSITTSRVTANAQA
jgi:hypothetical protein